MFRRKVQPCPKSDRQAGPCAALGSHAKCGDRFATHQFSGPTPSFHHSCRYLAIFTSLRTVANLLLGYATSATLTICKADTDCAHRADRKTPHSCRQVKETLALRRPQILRARHQKIDIMPFRTAQLWLGAESHTTNFGRFGYQLMLRQRISHVPQPTARLKTGPAQLHNL